MYDPLPSKDNQKQPLMKKEPEILNEQTRLHPCVVWNDPLENEEFIENC